MAITPGTERILQAAAEWRDRSLVRGESVFIPGLQLWTAEHLDELITYYVERQDESSRSFLEKLKDQLEPAPPETCQLAAEMLWFMMLFPSNIGAAAKTELVAKVWEWSGEPFPRDHPLVTEVFRRGIGSGGTGYNNHRPDELTFFILLMRDWCNRSPGKQGELLGDPWRFGAWVDTVPGSQRRQLRHMLLHMLWPEVYERVASNGNKKRIDAAFENLLASVHTPPDAAQKTLLGQDLRLLLIRRELERQYPGQMLDFYGSPLVEVWRPVIEVDTPGYLPVPEHETPPRSYVEPSFTNIATAVRTEGLRIDERMLERYHRSLKTRGFLILSGVSGTGKTWLAEAYARAVGAEVLIVPVAPNWTTNEDLLGWFSPFDAVYHDTPFSRFLRQAAAEHAQAKESGRKPRPYHLVLDEMNLARVEHYFARFLSAMEVRARGGEAAIELAPGERVALPDTLRFIGTVNVDETTHGFADKVLDRAQLIELEAPRDALAEHLAGRPWAADVLALWDAMAEVAPFAFRVLDEIAHYVGDAAGDGWEERVDEQILQKVLPRVRGTDPRLGDALAAIEVHTAGRFPLSLAKVQRMRDGYRRHGFASYH
jgi:hypothetical protein